MHYGEIKLYIKTAWEAGGGLSALNAFCLASLFVDCL